MLWLTGAQVVIIVVIRTAGACDQLDGGAGGRGGGGAGGRHQPGRGGRGHLAPAVRPAGSPSPRLARHLLGLQHQPLGPRHRHRHYQTKM